MVHAGSLYAKLDEVLANTEAIRAILPALTMMYNPFHSASSLTSTEAKLQASDFKSRLLQYYFAPHPPPGLFVPSFVTSTAVIQQDDLHGLKACVEQ